jgi:PAS domain S-box-containing protein
MHLHSSDSESLEEIKRLKGTLADLIDSLPSIILVVDCQGRVDLWNKKAELFSGVTSADARGALAESLLPHFAQQLKHAPEVINRQVPWNHGRIQLNRNGQRSFYDVQICALTSEGAGRAVVRIDDISEQVRIEDIMMQTEKMLMVGGLAAGMAHEINNPLGAILQNAQNIERRVSAEIEANHAAARAVGVTLDQIREYLDKRGIITFIGHIRQAGSRASTIINNMLHFSRASESRVETVALARVIDQTLELAGNDYDMKKNFDFKNIEIVRDYDAKLPPVTMTVLEIEQVLLNIVKNAAQALAGCGVGHKPVITVRTRCSGELALLEIEDNGPGMDEITTHRIFEPFFTTKDVGVGTGLGLAVSYAIITKNHRGRIEVASEPGAGARFTIHLPIKGRTL